MDELNHRVRQAYGRKLGVATEEPLASAAAARVLFLGGNAVDASVAASLVLGVVAPHLGGLGGDYFALIRTPDGRVDYVNGSGHAPRGLKRELFLDRGLRSVPPRGPLSPTVPGMIDALYRMWRRHGSMEWRDLVEPAIRLAREGFPAPPSLAKAIKTHASELAKDPGSRRTYLENTPMEPGTTVKFEGLARLLEEIAGDPRSFYEGSPAERIEEYLAERGGVLALDDMRTYEAAFEDPVNASYHGWTVWEMPPNTQGITTLHMLKVLEQWRLPRDPRSRLYYILSAAGVVYEARDRELGDPRYMKMNVEELLSEDYIGMMRSIAARGPPECARLAGASSGDGDTTHYTVMDGDGMIVSGIQSLFQPFGSMVTEPVYQVTLHGRASGFTLQPGRPNTLEPGKKPLHTLSAVIAVAGDRILSLGVSGGHFRPQQHAFLVTSVVDHGYSIGEAIALPRLLWTPWTCRLTVDPGVGAWGVPPGYEVVAGRTGVANGLYSWPGGLAVATDYRGDGYPVASG
ncbi:MAG: gamma-glutamyltransferase family protein [Desulfurococcales archaeon]|nr:gamma-glutamyltransferase family protein [Desulfurococcales archaeon]